MSLLSLNRFLFDVYRSLLTFLLAAQLSFEYMYVSFWYIQISFGIFFGYTAFL